MTSVPPFPAALLVASVLAVLLFHSPAGAQYESFAEEASVVVVEVPVTVVHRGEPVEGLEAGDFALFDRGERQEIRSFEVLRVDPGAPEADGEGAGGTEEGAEPAATPALAARRNFLFLFDLAYADSRSLAGAASALEELLARGLAPDDRAGVGFFSAPRGFQWVVGLTDRHDEVARALEVLRAVIASDPDRTRELLAGWAPAAATEPPGATPDREALMAEAGLSWHNRNATGWPTTSILRHFVRGLGRIAEATAGLDGRKYLVHLSYGLPDWLVSGRSSERARVLGLLQRLKRSCRESGWAIQSVNLAGLGWGRDSLFMMAEDTGGQLFTNSNDVGLLVREMEALTRVTYLLTFQPEDLEADGAFHRLKVEVDGLPRGARVVHRPGYYAPE